jgi:hypothetical protein
MTRETGLTFDTTGGRASDTREENQMQNDQEQLIELRVRITRRQRRLLKIYQLTHDLPSKDEALQAILAKFFEAEG